MDFIVADIGPQRQVEAFPQIPLYEWPPVPSMLGAESSRLELWNWQKCAFPRFSPSLLCYPLLAVSLFSKLPKMTAPPLVGPLVVRGITIATRRACMSVSWITRFRLAIHHPHRSFNLGFTLIWIDLSAVKDLRAEITQNHSWFWELPI